MFSRSLAETQGEGMGMRKIGRTIAGILNELASTSSDIRAGRRSIAKSVDPGLASALQYAIALRLKRLRRWHV
jgi:hypothetical protein